MYAQTDFTQNSETESDTALPITLIYQSIISLKTLMLFYLFFLKTNHSYLFNSLGALNFSP